MDKILAILFSNEVVLGYILAGIVAVVGIVKKKYATKLERYEKGVLFLETGCKEVWDETVKDLKKNAQDGKLTKDERKKAFETAKAKAVSYAKEDGWNLLKIVADQAIPAIVDRILKSKKKD